MIRGDEFSCADCGLHVLDRRCKCRERPQLPEEHEWVVNGAPVLYQPSLLSEQRYRGTVRGYPRLLGETWVVGLVEMDPGYRDGKRSHVPAAALDNLRPAPTPHPPTAVQPDPEEST